MCKVYVLAQKLMDDETSATIFAGVTSPETDYSDPKNCPSLKAVQVIYKGTPCGNDMRTFLCNVISDHGDSRFISKDLRDDNTAAEWPQEFLLDLTQNLFHTRYTLKQYDARQAMLEWMGLDRDCIREQLDAEVQNVKEKHETISNKDRMIDAKEQIIKNNDLELALSRQQDESYKLIIDQLIAATKTKN